MHVTVKDLVKQTGRHKTTMILALERWEKECGKHTLLARAGGRQKRLLLTQQDAEEFLIWYFDYPR
jgi:hypothetical protein